MFAFLKRKKISIRPNKKNQTSTRHWKRYCMVLTKKITKKKLIETNKNSSSSSSARKKGRVACQTHRPCVHFWIFVAQLDSSWIQNSGKKILTRLWMSFDLCPNFILSRMLLFSSMMNNMNFLRKKKYFFQQKKVKTTTKTTTIAGKTMISQRNQKRRKKG